MSYFRNFPKVDYTLDKTGVTKEMVDLTAFARINVNRLDNVAHYSWYTISDGDRPENVSYRLYGTTDYYWTFFLINEHIANYYDDWPKSSSSLLEYCKTKYPYHAGLVDSEEIIAGKFNIGEIVTGQQSLAVGYIKEKYPTDGYVVIEVISGTFLETGESILGSTTEDSIDCKAIVPQYLAPHHHINDLTQEVTQQAKNGTTPVTLFEYEQDRNNTKARIRVIKPDLIASIVSEFVREIKR